MLALTHAAVGATSTIFTKSSVLAFSFGFLAHFIFDKVPHFWPQKEKFQGIMLAFDWIITALVIFALFSQKENVAAFGALGGFAVDLILIPAGKIKKNKISTWHSQRQPHKLNPLYLFTDLTALFLVLLLIWRLK